mmetsp:Transcript_43070/g.114087  ORF Transcript_43070/g.114087 Transcript_43070/m.114087 type:complete len:222 (+) Transcript_43070:81-746(+)
MWRIAGSSGVGTTLLVARDGPGDMVCTNGCLPGLSLPSKTQEGRGRDTYVAETSYRYVGNGAGEYNLVRPSGRRAFFYLCVSTSLCTLMFALFFAFMELAPTSTTTAQVYDCGAGFSNLETEWSLGKKVWCCDKVGQGCPTEPIGPLAYREAAQQPPAERQSAPFDCAAGRGPPPGGHGAASTRARAAPRCRLRCRLRAPWHWRHRSSAARACPTCSRRGP